MPHLYVYHPGTGTVISLSDEVYLVNADIVQPEVLDLMENGATVEPFEHKGYRINNANMSTALQRHNDKKTS